MTSQPLPGALPVGTCPVCFHSGIRLTSKGVFYNHGPRSSQCPGTGLKPTGGQSGGSAASSSQPSSSSRSDTPLISSDPHSIEEGLIRAGSSLFGAEKQIIKWIPKGARAHCATLLTRLLNSVADHPDSPLGWANLLSFACNVLAKPSRGGGKARNLSNIFMKRCKNFYFISETDMRAGSLGGDSSDGGESKTDLT